MKFKCYLVYVELIKIKILSYYRTTNENSYCNKAYDDDFDTVLLGVSSPPTVSSSLYRDPSVQNVERSTIGRSGIKRDQPMPPRECWTPERSINDTEGMVVTSEINQRTPKECWTPESYN